MIQFHNISSLKKCQVLATGCTKKDMLEMPTFVQIKQMTWHQVTPSPFPMYTRLFKQQKNRRKVANHIHFFQKQHLNTTQKAAMCIFFKLKKAGAILHIWNLNKPV